MESKAEPAMTDKWGFALDELYRLAFSFYKQNSGKAVHLSYEDNLKLIAFKQQALFGSFDSKHAPELGVLDVIGRDRRLHWQMLGDMTREQAMEGFIDLLDKMCTAFRPYVEAVKQNRDETLKAELKRMEQEKVEKEKREREQKELLEEGYKEEVQRRQLQDALNKQTYQQFKSYAEKQFPGNPEQQARFISLCKKDPFHMFLTAHTFRLIHQLQQEHYHQYMQQLHLHQSNTQSSKDATSIPIITNDVQDQENGNDYKTVENSSIVATNVTQDESNELENFGEDDDYIVIKPAKIWTRPDIDDFKAEVMSGDGDGVLTIGHGDTVTVRVPTNVNGKCIFWEFATDNYDIGFGIYFEWSKPVSSEVTVHVSDSDDEEDGMDEDNLSTTDDLETGSLATERNLANVNASMKPPVSIIVPIYRRECFNEVYVGSHSYPGEGVYLLKFDNSYSIWRSKTLYYRVYYER